MDRSNQHSSPNENWNPNQKIDIQVWRGRNSNPRSDLNKTEPNCRRVKKTPQGMTGKAMPKLWRAMGPTQANHNKIDTANQRGSSKFVTLRKDRNQGTNPQRQAMIERLSERRPNDQHPKLCPTSKALQETNRNPKL